MAHNIKMDGAKSEEAKNEIEDLIAKALNKLSLARSIDEINDVRKLIGAKELETKNLKVDKRAKLIYSARAYLKMMALVLYNHEEVGWHATVKRGEADNEFFVKDVLVFPQIVDPTNVDVDDLEYDKWQWTLSPEQFEAMKFHGHSHVNMGVHPSGKDDAYRSKILEQLPDDSFYIFSIWNKKFDMEVTIYDYANNIVYESEDVDWDISVEGEMIGKFLDDTKDKIKHRGTASKNNEFPYINPCTNKIGKDRDKWDELDKIRILKGEH